MKVNRRDFLTFAGFTAAGVTLGRWGRERILKKEVFRESWGKGVERWSTSICGQCPAGCGIRVRVVDDRAVKVEGNPLCPIARGRLCPKGQAGLQALYDPRRLTGPVKRLDRRGEPRWQPVSWDEGLQTVSEKVHQLREAGNSHGLVVVSGRERGTMGVVLRRFMEAYGSPNLLEVESLRDPAAETAFRATQGLADLPGYDLEQTSYLLSFGCPVLESWLSPTYVHRMYGRMRRGSPERRGRFVQVESRLSPTAAKADEWIRIRPGTEAALVLGIAHVIIREGRYNEGFVRDQTFGFEDWIDPHGTSHIGFKTLVLNDYDPDAVARIASVPVVTVIRLAREFTRTERPLALGEHRPLSGGVSLLFAVQCLNALVGSLDAPGGVTAQRPLPLNPMPPSQPDETARRGRQQPRIDGAGGQFPLAATNLPGLSDAVLSGNPYPVKVLLLCGADPFSICPDADRLRRALERIPFIVSFSPLLDASSEFADLILPDHTPLEKWRDVVPPPWSGRPAVAVCRPAIAPLLKTRPTGEVLMEVAQRLGGTVAASFPWTDFSAVLRETLRGPFEARRGMVYDSSFEGDWLQKLEEGGWWAPTYGSFDEFWSQVLERGGWWDPAYTFGQWRRTLRTPSRRFEFFSQLLQSTGFAGGSGPAGSPSGLPGKRGGDRAFLPRYEPAAASEDGLNYPLILRVFEPLSLGGLSDPHQPFLQEISAPHLKAHLGPWVEINPQTARRLEIADGDPVWVESELGRIGAHARIFAGTMPDVVSVPVGVSASISWYRGEGATSGVGRETRTESPWRLVAYHPDPLTGVPVGGVAMVKVYRQG